MEFWYDQMFQVLKEFSQLQTTKVPDHDDLMI